VLASIKGNCDLTTYFNYSPGLSIISVCVHAGYKTLLSNKTVD